MHSEYAVEPAAIGSNWETFRYLIEKFGFQEGRLISRFPKTWERLVIEASKAAGVPDVARKRIVEKLQQKKRDALIKTGRAYNPELESWLENALASHRERPFRAIVSEFEHGNDVVVTTGAMEADHPRIVARTSTDIPRTPEDLANACSTLLCAAHEIDLVDPFFDLRNRGGDYRGPLERMLQALHSAGRENVCIRVHYRDHNSRPDETEMLRGSGHWSRGIIPDGFELHLYAWRERENGEDIHDRYLLCDCGGLMSGAGFSATGAQERATFSLLDWSHVQELRARFVVGSTVYEQVGRAVRVKSNGDTDFC